MHFKEVCTVCGKVVGQCRCIGEKQIIDTVCDECKETQYKERNSVKFD